MTKQTRDTVAMASKEDDHGVRLRSAKVVRP